MEIQRLFKLLKSLTVQSNLRDLIASFQALLAENFDNVCFNVYELQATRIEHKKDPCIICLDCELQNDAFLLDDDSLMNKAVTTLATTFQTAPLINRAVYPVILYDKSVSHIIAIKHKYKNDTARELLFGLLEIFTDIFRSIHEKGYDPLTRILNRQAFDQTAAELAYANKNSKKANIFSAIAILDIDKFKEVNDLYGHAIGDETLVLFTQTIRSILRQEDLFFRYGGEEFVVLVRDVKQEQALQVLERCRAAIENKRFPQVGRVTVSIGVANLDNQLHPIENLSKADKALYYIKRNGRNKVHSYEYLLKKDLLKPITFKEGAVDFWD